MHLAMLINTQELAWDESYEEPRIDVYTKLMWMPININQSSENLITYTSHELDKKEKESDQYQQEVPELEKLNWIGVNRLIEIEPFSEPLTKPTVKTRVIF